MTRFLNSGRTLAALTLAALASVALPASSALAQKVKDKTETTGQPSTETTEPSDVDAGNQEATPTEFTVTVGDIEAEGANIDEETLRQILSGDITGHAEELASLQADRIAVPELRIEFTVPLEEGGSETGSFTYTDLEFTDIADGVAASASIAGGSSDMSTGGNVQLGAMSAENLDIGGLLAFYGLVPADDGDEFRVLYQNFRLDGGTLTMPEGSCTFGAVTNSEFSARPLAMPFGELMTLAGRLEAQGENPAPEDIAQFVAFYADMLTAFESTETRLEGFDCSGTGEDGTSMEISLGEMVLGEWTEGRYPDLSVSGFTIAGGDGTMSLDSATFKGFDLSRIVETLETAGTELNEQWFAENYRSVIPPFEGLSFSGFSVDIPDPDAAEERIQFSIGDADLTLANYVNGIPATISSFMNNLVVDIPTNSSDEQVQQLLALGIEQLDVGYEISAAWDEQAGTITVDRLALTGAELGTIALAAVIGNATEALFSTDTNEAMASAMTLTAKSLSIDLENAGLVDLILQGVAQQQGGDAEQLREQFSGMAQATILALLGGGSDVQQLSQAVGQLVNGAANFSLSITANEEAGLSLTEFMALQSGNPAALLNSVTLEASASE